MPSYIEYFHKQSMPDELMPRALEYLHQAIHLADMGRFSTHPNPRVGCIIVKNNQIIGEGFHQQAGGPHAEIIALQQAAENAVGSTCYVSLEPCCHHGRTGPCTQALIDAKVAQVVFAAVDPNPQVAGEGAKALTAAGIKVSGPLLSDEVIAQNPGFFKRWQSHKPWLRLKIAMSLDSKIALSSGESRWITNDLARAVVHQWRAQSDAVLTSVNTVLADDPLLTVRNMTLPDSFKQPLLVILDHQCRTPADARLFQQSRPVMIYTINKDQKKHALLKQQGAEVVCFDAPNLDVDAVLSDLAKRAINEVWCEAGQTLSSALIAADAVDELVIHLAPKILGDTALSAFSLAERPELIDAHTFDLHHCEQMGKDVQLVYRRR